MTGFENPGRPPAMLVVTGSRSCARDRQREAWAREQLTYAMRGLGAQDAVLSGGADGPDTWAREIALQSGVTIEEFRLDGKRYRDGVATDRLWTPLLDAAPPYDPALAWPLKRDLAVVHAATVARACGWSVFVLGLTDPASPTHGTAFTVKHARLAQLALADLRYPNGLEEEPGLAAVAEPEECDPTAFGDADLLVADTETTGWSRDHCAMIELALIRTSPRARRVLAAYEAKIQLPRDAYREPRAMAVNGYSEARWADAKPLAVVLREAAPLFAHRPRLVAHNATFDDGFIMVSHDRVGLPRPVLDPDPICTLKLARKHLKGRGLIAGATLTDVCRYLGIVHEDAHEAMPDARACLGILRKLVYPLDAEEAGASP